MAPKRKRPRIQYSSQASSIVESTREEENPTEDDLNNIDKPGDGADHKTTDAEELSRAQRVARTSQSDSYDGYFEPELSDQKDKHHRHMIAYPCKLCGVKIHRPTTDSSCSNLRKHTSNCERKQNQIAQSQLLAALGITGTGDITPQEVPQLCAIWCAEAARPFLALVDSSHKAILHPTVVKFLPKVHAVSKDIHLLYSAIQHEYRAILNAHQGSLYLGVNAWQSPNAYDILGVVIYRLAKGIDGQLNLEAMPLDFVCLSESHSGEYLAETVALVVEKFGIQHKICGIVSNNAKNNEVMVKELKKLKWSRFKGAPQWIRCFAHILNLIAQAILRPFETHKANKDTNGGSSTNTGDDLDHGEYDNAEQIRLLPHGDTSPAPEDEDPSDTDSLPQLDDNDSDSLSEGDIENASDEGEGDLYTSASCKQTLAKFRMVAKKLKYSPNSKAEFVKLCVAKKCATPHNISRDVCTRWNSTSLQLSSIVRCQAAILEWQRHKSLGLERKYHLDLARDLAGVLNMFHEITLQISVAGSARLSNVVLFIDQITEHLSTIISNPVYPAALRNACRLGLKKTNKYYSLTDTSPLYRIAILLHPSLRDKYFKLAKWEPEWIAEAIRLARNMWVSHYKPPPITPSSSAPSSSKPITGMLAGLGVAAAAQGGDSSSDPLDLWLAGGPVLNGNAPVNPLKWWIQQKKLGNTYGGLVNMALDVLSCPATSVDVERAFSFGQDYVSSKRHRLAPHSVSRGMTVAFYSKNKKIKEGFLAKWKQGLNNSKKTKQKSRRKVIVVEDNDNKEED
ncbi:hypothetical protein PSTG_06187 [Puccinia striiformis f. sp. tritici PST-78]|uniref:HAT C-terminal dimerisation domain-containing protein n=1 Tax=Puccinia striiformis f. sp. tritici PST-78 TaxID=1165861 RepID=A0A0L0VMM3_9BASI|nr:hypothetical protein PSTG_06187 [Puccinia striiformis f. sp. tritici PST-78]